MSLADIDGDLAWHSAEYDHALDHDEDGNWFCLTCALDTEDELTAWQIIDDMDGDTND